MSDKHKRTALLIVVVLCFAMLLGIVRMFRGVTPESVLSQVFNFNAPTRYAFVSDVARPVVAVIDVIQGQQVGTVTLKVRPDFWAMDAKMGVLLYAQQGSEIVHIYHTTTQQHSQFSVSIPILRWQYHQGTHQLIVASQNRVAAFDVLHHQLLSHVAISNIDAIAIDPIHNLVWMRSSANQALLAWNPAAHHLTRYPYPQSWDTFSSFALDPTGNYLIFSAGKGKENQQIVLWDLQKHQYIFAKHQLPAPVIQPYISDNGSTAWLFNQQGQGIVIDLANREEKRVDIAHIDHVQHYFSGWLNQKGLFIAPQRIFIFDDQRGQITAEIPASVQDVFITSNSKTALATVQHEAKLISINIRNGSTRTLSLDGIHAADKVIMGASGTLCH